MRHRLILAAAVLSVPAGALALQASQGVPGAADPARVAAGRYTLDGAHTQVAFSVDHFGFNSYWGLFGKDSSGALTLDPANPSAASVEITIPVGAVQTTSDGLNRHLQGDDFFDVANHADATFRSTRVEVNGTQARITGDLTLRGTTRPVVLDARFTGAGTNPMNSKETVGFEATTTLRRSEFGIDYALPAVSDEVELKISAAFERD